jgi:nucleoside 2-deoxyribosyltransferase
MKIYISGPMTGYPEMNFPEFERVATELRGLGYTALSPHEVELPQYPKGFKPKTKEEATEMWLAFMREDIKLLMDADIVVTLDGWETSKGATIEVTLGRSLGMEDRMASEVISARVV